MKVQFDLFKYVPNELVLVDTVTLLKKHTYQFSIMYTNIREK